MPNILDPKEKSFKKVLENKKIWIFQYLGPEVKDPGVIILSDNDYDSGPEMSGLSFGVNIQDFSSLDIPIPVRQKPRSLKSRTKVSPRFF